MTVREKNAAAVKHMLRGIPPRGSVSVLNIMTCTHLSLDEVNQALLDLGPEAESMRRVNGSEIRYFSSMGTGATGKTVDGKSYDLAVHFLTGDPNTPRHFDSEDHRMDMARRIQQAVEDWFLEHEASADDQNAEFLAAIFSATVDDV